MPQLFGGCLMIRNLILPLKVKITALVRGCVNLYGNSREISKSFYSPCTHCVQYSYNLGKKPLAFRPVNAANT